VGNDADVVHNATSQPTESVRVRSRSGLGRSEDLPVRALQRVHALGPRLERRTIVEQLGAKHLVPFEQAQIETDPRVNGRARHLPAAFRHPPQLRLSVGMSLFQRLVEHRDHGPSRGGVPFPDFLRLIRMVLRERLGGCVSLHFGREVRATSRASQRHAASAQMGGWQALAAPASATAVDGRGRDTTRGAVLRGLGGGAGTAPREGAPQ